ALAISLLAGLRGAAYGRRALFILPSAWLVGGLLGIMATKSPTTAFTSVSFIILGLLVAADVHLSLRALSVLAGVIGLFHGYLNGFGMTFSVSVALLGLIAVVFMLVAIIAALVVRLHWPASRIAVRVVGSWIAASGLLMVGWALR